MLKEQTRLVAASAYALDLAATAAAFSAAHLLRSSILPALLPASFPLGLFPFSQYAALLPWVLLVWTATLLSARSYRSQRLAGLPELILASAKVAFGSALILTAVVFALRFDFVSRPFLALFAVLDFVFLAGVRVSVRLVARSVRKRGYNYRTVLVVGTGRRAVSLTESILAHAHWGLRLAGFVTDHEHPSEVPAGVRIVGALENLPELLTDHGNPIDEVVFVVSRRRLAELDAAFHLCEELGIRTRVALDFLPLSLARIELEEFDGVPLLTMTSTPSDPFALAGKRFADVTLSGLLLLALSPLFALVALAIRLSSRGGVLFRQTRCGLNGRRFTLRKFRTMVAGAEELLDDVRHLNEMTGPVFKAKGDPRVTPVGRFLRRWSLDELPQLWNVFRGDMSLVGPRPPIPEEVDRYERWQRRRLSMKPGLTCLWQVSGRNELDFEDWMNLDLEYIDNWTPMLDVKILARTIPAVLSGRGAR